MSTTEEFSLQHPSQKTQLRYWQNQLKQLSPRYSAFINGKSVDPQQGQFFQSYNPYDGSFIAEVARCQAEDVNQAVQAARHSFELGVWSRCHPRERKKVLNRLAQLILEHQDQLALFDCIEIGKPIHDALTMDVVSAAALLEWYAEATDKIYDEVAPTHQEAVAFITRQPIGVVSAVIPWNFPLNIALWKVAPALAAGNSVVLKPAKESSLSALLLAQLAAQAGLPDGVFNVITGYGQEAGQALGLHHDVDCVTFTDSTEIDKRFLSYSAQSNMKVVWLECGGKSPNIVFADCRNLAAAARKAAFGIFSNQGQVCSASSRLLVERSIHTPFLDLLIKEIQQLKIGNPLDPQTQFGCLVSKDHAQRVKNYIAQGIYEGAHLLHGNTNTHAIDAFVEPTVFTNVTPEMIIAQEEIFGPVLSVLSFDHEEEAIQLANHSIYGLAAAVWTDDLRRTHRIAKALHAGTVSVNTVDALDPCTPFGGCKQSGFGRDLSLHALDKFTQLKTTWIDLSI